MEAGSVPPEGIEEQREEAAPDPGPGPAGTDPAGPAAESTEGAPAEEPATDEHNPEAPLDDPQAAADASADPAPAESEVSDDAAAEPEPGVGDATHPAPATTTDPETGESRQHGQIDSSLGVTPTGDSTDEQSGDVSPEAAEALGGVHDSAEQGVEVERPDIGTPGE